MNSDNVYPLNISKQVNCSTCGRFYVIIPTARTARECPWCHADTQQRTSMREQHALNVVFATEIREQHLKGELDDA